MSVLSDIPETAPVVLRALNIRKSFNEEEVLRGVSFDVRKGEVKVFIGPSGTGKTTDRKSVV